MAEEAARRVMVKFTLAEAKKRLESSSREQLVDHAFSDAEVYWFVSGQSVASGYFGNTSEVGLDATADREATEFRGSEADELRYCGTLTRSERNDSGGDD